MRKVIILSDFLLALGLPRAEQLPSSCVAPSISCAVGAVLSLAHTVVLVVQLHLMPPFFPAGDKENGRRSEDHTATFQTPSQLTCSLPNSNVGQTSSHGSGL